MVIYEYEKFLNLYYLTPNINLIPPDDIERCWQAHILDTELYYKYCISKFGKILHYKLNLFKKKEDIAHTYKLYLQKYGEPKYKLIWTISTFRNMIKHNLIPEIKLDIYDKFNKLIQCYYFYPNSLDTFDKIFIFINIRYNINVQRCKIYIDINKANNINLKQVTEVFKLNKDGEISNKFKIIDFVNNNITNYNIFLT
jgi:hypothetical protein